MAQSSPLNLRGQAGGRLGTGGGNRWWGTFWSQWLVSLLQIITPIVTRAGNRTHAYHYKPLQAFHVLNSDDTFQTLHSLFIGLFCPRVPTLLTTRSQTVPRNITLVKLLGAKRAAASCGELRRTGKRRRLRQVSQSSPLNLRGQVGDRWWEQVVGNVLESVACFFVANNHTNRDTCRESNPRLPLQPLQAFHVLNSDDTFQTLHSLFIGLFCPRVPTLLTTRSQTVPRNKALMKRLGAK